jgi:hypothetical protein
MRGNVALIPILLGICVAIPAQAAETSPLKCGVNEDRIWVYDSLNSFDVAMKLKCGEPVEIISREKGYVKIRIAGGREGYVEAKALPKAPGAEEPNQSSSEAQASQKQRQLVAAAASRDRTPVSAAGTSVKPAESAPANGNATKPNPVPDPARSASSSASSTKNTTPPVAEKNNSVAAPNSVASHEQPSVLSVANHAEDQPTHSPTSATKASDSTATTKAAHTTPSAAKPPRSTMAAKTDSNNADAKVKASSSKTLTVSSSSSTTPKATKAASTKAVSSKTAAASRASIVVEPVSPPASANVALADNISIEPQPDSRNAHASASPRDPDEEEDAPMESLGSQENCKLYFSAYGLSPNQYRWMTQSRGKNFSGICPAPAPTMVDFVVIFTHDADFFNGTMPTPVHTDKNGFSDFTPLSTIDTAVVSPSDADKNRREYVWVFHTKRGTFNPATFSPKRRPLFSTTESNKLGTAAGSRSAEDALRFIEQHGADR